MSVLESIVILGPICQVGWARASATVTRSSSAGLRPRKGPPLAVSTMDDTRSGRSLARRHWWTAQCSESTGIIAAPEAARARRTTGPARDQRLLVGQPEPLAGLQGGQGDREAREADDPVDDGVGRRGRRGHGVGAGQQLDPLGQPLGQVGGPVGVGDGHHVWAEPVRLLGEQVHRAGRAQRGHPVPVGPGLDDVERLRSDRSGRAEHRYRRHQGQVTPVIGSVRPVGPLHPSADLRSPRSSGPRSTWPAARTASRRSGRGPRHGRAAANPCP